MGILRDRMIEEMQLRNFAASTQKSYLYTITKLAQYYNRPPDQLGKEQIRSYLLYLTTERKLSPNTMTALIAGLVIILGQFGDGVEVRLLGTRSEVPKLHLLDHSVT